MSLSFCVAVVVMNKLLVLYCSWWLIEKSNKKILPNNYTIITRVLKSKIAHIEMNFTSSLLRSCNFLNNWVEGSHKWFVRVFRGQHQLFGSEDQDVINVRFFIDGPKPTRRLWNLWTYSSLKNTCRTEVSAQTGL